MGSRKSPRGAATVATESTPTSTPPRLTTEERRRRILDGLDKMDDQGIRRVDWFVQAILEDDPVLMSLASARVEEEPLTEEERQAVEESRREMEAGEFLTHEEVRRLWLGERG